ncbi:MAG TPA: helicase C-terminal domain-containing protein, partial [Flavobacterium sp.]|nr:helicase C-terminal domain-containing protein [Flavobacterium sp.]
ILSAALKEVENFEIEEIIKNLTEHIHEDFFAISYLRKGVVYLHGRMPDNIKEYLEHKFASTKNIKYLVANKVVLEGVNLPVDSLFIMNTFSLTNKDLTNLIGRVNRLNSIFSNPGKPDLLMPEVHFVNTERFNRKDGKMERSITSLRKGIESDVVQNPLLYEFDIEQYHPERESAKIRDAQKIISEEIIFESSENDPIINLKRSMVEVGLGSIYNLAPLLCETIYSRLNTQHSNDSVIDLIYEIFIKDLNEFIIDNEFGRLTNKGTRLYYQSFLTTMHEKSFKYQINRQVAIFTARIKNPELNSIVYLGDKLGELPSPNDQKNLYVDLSKKSRVDLVNLSIAKLKIENDFIGYKLLMVIQLLLNYEVISKDAYHHIAYGTTDENKINLIRLGLSLRIINKIDEDLQLSNLIINSNNSIVANDTFKEYLLGLDDLTRFEISKIL